MPRSLIVLAVFVVILSVLATNCGNKMTPEQMRAQALDLANKENFDGAVKAYEKLVKAYPNHEFAGESLYKIGLLYTQKIDNSKKAIEAFERLVEKYPSDVNTDKALVRLGSLYSKNLNEPEKAIQAFEKLIATFPNSPLKTESEIWISYLCANNLKDTGRAKANLDKYGYSALKLRKQGDTFEQNESFENAMATYETIATVFPDTVFVDSTLFKLGTLYSNNLKNLDQSVNSYRRLVENYPASKLIAQSQFMIGYTYANLIKDLDKARQEYELFIKKFPKNELASSVQWELEHLGKDISDIDFLSKDNQKDKKSLQ